MSRFTIYAAIFMVLFNMTAMGFTASGTYEDWGIGPDPGGDKAISAANSSAESILAIGEGGAATLFRLIISVISSIIEILVLAAVGGPIMLNNLGFPAWLNTLVFAPIYIIIAADVVHLLLGNDTI